MLRKEETSVSHLKYQGFCLSQWTVILTKNACCVYFPKLSHYEDEHLMWNDCIRRATGFRTGLPIQRYTFLPLNSLDSAKYFFSVCLISIVTRDLKSDALQKESMDLIYEKSGNWRVTRLREFPTKRTHDRS